MVSSALSRAPQANVGNSAHGEGVRETPPSRLPAVSVARLAAPPVPPAVPPRMAASECMGEPTPPHARPPDIPPEVVGLLGSGMVSSAPSRAPQATAGSSAHGEGVRETPPSGLIACRRESYCHPSWEAQCPEHGPPAPTSKQGLSGRPAAAPGGLSHCLVRSEQPGERPRTLGCPAARPTTPSAPPEVPCPPPEDPAAGARTAAAVRTCAAVNGSGMTRAPVSGCEAVGVVRNVPGSGADLHRRSVPASASGCEGDSRQAPPVPEHPCAPRTKSMRRACGSSSGRTPCTPSLPDS